MTIAEASAAATCRARADGGEATLHSTSRCFRNATGSSASTCARMRNEPLQTLLQVFPQGFQTTRTFRQGLRASVVLLLGVIGLGIRHGRRKRWTPVGHSSSSPFTIFFSAYASHHSFVSEKRAGGTPQTRSTDPGSRHLDHQRWCYRYRKCASLALSRQWQ